jgi:hypothetical protein
MTIRATTLIRIFTRPLIFKKCPAAWTNARATNPKNRLFLQGLYDPSKCNPYWHVNIIVRFNIACSQDFPSLTDVWLWAGNGTILPGIKFNQTWSKET